MDTGAYVMRLPVWVPTVRVRVTTAALVLAWLAVWRMPFALGMSQESEVFAGSVLSIILAAALFLLFRHAFSCADRRLKLIVYPIGFLFSGFTLVGKQLEASASLADFSIVTVLEGSFSLLLFTVVYGAGLLLIFQGMQKLAQPKPPGEKESLVSRIFGNFFVVFALMVLCWLPAWLSFWPGIFNLDSGTQLYTYLDWVHSTHHPLLHTLFLGYCIMLGVELTAEGSAAVGLAIYSVVQLTMMAGIVAYACSWLRRKAAPVVARIMVIVLFALFPSYAIWSFSALKDVLFGGLVLLFVIQLIDLWQDQETLLRSPLRIVRFIVIAVLMMLMRNNGIYALVLFMPFAVVLAKGARIRITALLAGCAALYLLANGALIWATEATQPCKIEMLSIPLQQIARTLRDHPDELALDTENVLDTLYDINITEIYAPQVADPLKWAADYDEVDDNLPQLISLWARMGIRNPISYLEAFLIQNLPYYLPGSEMVYKIDSSVIQIDLYYIEEHCFLPTMRTFYENYSNTLSAFGLPGVRLLSDTAFFVWLCIAGVGYALYLRQRQWLPGFVFLLGIWCTCLVGPVAITRYMLGFFYAIPVLFAAMLAHAKNVVPKQLINQTQPANDVTQNVIR